jgi:hypothetical protein
LDPRSKQIPTLTWSIGLDCLDDLDRKSDKSSLEIFEDLVSGDVEALAKRLQRRL